MASKSGSSRSGGAKRSRKRKSASEISNIYSWTAEDELLSGLPDPTPTVEVDPIALAAWEKEFYTAIANDHEFWAEREHQDSEEVVQEDISPQTEYTGDMLTEILQADMGLVRRLLYLSSMLIIYCFIVLPFHIIIWAFEALRSYYHEHSSMERDQGGE